jgi:hypothetical protein
LGFFLFNLTEGDKGGAEDMNEAKKMARKRTAA